MRLTARDVAIIESVNRFGQLSSGHVWRFHFDNTNRNSLDRVLRRLTALKLLARIERRMVGGDRGGSGQYVYQLGAMGHDYLGKRGKFAPAHRTVKRHILEIADAFADFRDAERAGDVKILSYLTEPDSHMEIVGVTVRPDLFIEVELIGRGEGVSLWLEIDRGFEGPGVIAAKVSGYVQIMANATSGDIETVPAIVFVVPDALRQRTIQSVLNREAGEWLGLFSVVLKEELLTTVS